MQIYTESIPVIWSDPGHCVFDGNLITAHAKRQKADQLIVLCGDHQTTWNPTSSKEENQFIGPVAVLYQGINSKLGVSVIIL